MMEATFDGQLDSLKWRIAFNCTPHTSPPCCVYSRTGSGFSWFHATAFIFEIHYPVKIYRFIASRYLTTSWRIQYEGIEFPVPSQQNIDEVLFSARERVERCHNTEIPVAFTPPRGPPPKNTSKILRSWYERGPKKKKKRVMILFYVVWRTTKPSSTIYVRYSKKRFRKDAMEMVVRSAAVIIL